MSEQHIIFPLSDSIHSHAHSFICHLVAAELWNWFQGLWLFNKDSSMFFFFFSAGYICIFTISDTDVKPGMLMRVWWMWWINESVREKKLHNILINILIKNEKEEYVIWWNGWSHRSAGIFLIGAFELLRFAVFMLVFTFICFFFYLHIKTYQDEMQWSFLNWNQSHEKPFENTKKCFRTSIDSGRLDLNAKNVSTSFGLVHFHTVLHLWKHDHWPLMVWSLLTKPFGQHHVVKAGACLGLFSLKQGLTKKRNSASKKRKPSSLIGREWIC